MFKQTLESHSGDQRHVVDRLFFLSDEQHTPEQAQALTRIVFTLVVSAIMLVSELVYEITDAYRLAAPEFQQLLSCGGLFHSDDSRT